jgi:Domain of unknown function (DUF4279)
MSDDEYPTCAKTYATLRIYPGDIDPSAITERLGIEPSSWQRRGEIIKHGRRPKAAPSNGWFLKSEGEVESRDSARHIDWLLDKIAPHSEAIRTLQEMGCKMDISCYWRSAQGHGGPTILPSQMRRLSDLNIELWFDFYNSAPDEDVILQVLARMQELEGRTPGQPRP